MKIKTMKLGKIFLGISIARKGTLWINRHKTSRKDHLISLTRTYMRKDRVYIYTLILGRLSMKVILL